MHVSVQFGRSRTVGVKKHWEVNVNGEAGWGPVKASVGAKYGKEYTHGLTTNRSKRISTVVKDGWTAWMVAVIYRHRFWYKGYTYRWNSKKKKCVKRTLAKASWQPPQVQYVVKHRKGRYYP